MINYADDTTLYSTLSMFAQQNGTNTDDMLNAEISQINAWLVANKLIINAR